MTDNHTRINFKKYVRSLIYNIPILGGKLKSVKSKYNGKIISQSALKLYKSILPKESCLCFDIGANTGYISEALLSLGNTVIAIEPQPECIEQLRNKFSNYPQLTIKPLAISTEVGVKTLFINKSNLLSTLSNKYKDLHKYKDAPYYKEIEVKTTTLANLILEYGVPYFCKVDVEGFEKEVLETLETAIPLISFEFITKDEDGLKEAIAIAEMINQLGNYTFNYSVAQDYRLELDTWCSLESLKELLYRDSKVQAFCFGDIYARLVN